MIRFLAGLLLVAVGASDSAAYELNSRLEMEARYFPQASGETLTGSVAGTAELFHGWRNDKERLVAELFVRADAHDDARTHADARELYFQAIGRDFEFRAGARRVFWGVTESRHLVDVINQSDFVEDLDNEAKLGQPMMNLALVRGFGTLELFLLPYQRARTFPGPEGHPDLPFPVAADEARYESARGQRHLDFALRYQGSVGPFDVGLAWFDGTARDPTIQPCLRRGSGFRGTDSAANCDILGAIDLPQSPFPPPVTQILQALGLVPTNAEEEARITAEVLRNIVLVPHYPRLRQVSLDAQYVYEALALKLEALLREREGGRSAAAVAGFEYTFGDVGGSGWDVGVLGEYLHDERDDFLSTRADHDVFAGMRVGFNDVAGTQLLAGAIGDRGGDDQVYQLEASRRLGDDWKLSAEARVFTRVPANSPAAFIGDEDQLTVTLERFF